MDLRGLSWQAGPCVRNEGVPGSERGPIRSLRQVLAGGPTRTPLNGKIPPRTLASARVSCRRPWWARNYGRRQCANSRSRASAFWKIFEEDRTASSLSSPAQRALGRPLFSRPGASPRPPGEVLRGSHWTRATTTRWSSGRMPLGRYVARIRTSQSRCLRIQSSHRLLIWFCLVWSMSWTAKLRSPSFWTTSTGFPANRPAPVCGGSSNMHRQDSISCWPAGRSQTCRWPVLRAHGELLELRAADLRFTSDEASAFLNGRLGLDLTAEDVDSLLLKTEGWPAGLYLAALSLQSAADRHAFVRTFGGSNRHVVDFLVSEVLEAHDPPAQALMLRASILDRLTGPLCDAVMEQEGSAQMLETLSRSNLFLVPLDDEAGSYRFHHVFGQLLRVELERREPGLAPALHRRAYSWHRDHGTTDEAIEHAVAAKDYAEAVELIETFWIRYANTWKYDTVLAWLGKLPEDVVTREVHLLLIQAWVLSLSAKQQEAARAIAAIERVGDLGVGPLRDGFCSAEASLTLLRASFPWGDVDAQVKHARRAVELEGPGSPWRSLACWAAGMGLYFKGRA